MQMGEESREGSLKLTFKLVAFRRLSMIENSLVVVAFIAISYLDTHEHMNGIIVSYKP